MTLDQLWREINQNYYTIKSLSNKVNLDLWSKVSSENKELLSLIDGLYDASWSGNVRAFDMIYMALIEIQFMFQDGYQHLDKKVDAAATKIDTLFSKNMYFIIDAIKEAIDLVLAESTGGGDGLKGYIDDSIDSVIDRIDSEVISLEQTIESDIDDVKSLITTKYDQVKNWVDDTFGDVWDWVTGGIDDLWKKSKQYAKELFSGAKDLISELYDDLENAVLSIRTSVINYYNQAKTYAETLFAEIELSINKVINNFNSAIERTRHAIEHWVNDLISVVYANIKIARETVEAALDQLSILSDWRFQFFTWFVIKPELAMLNVLTRNDEAFEYYKPYWQAFFARVLEET